MDRIVEFPSEGATLRGRLYAGLRRAGPPPLVIMAHGFSATINGMVADRYAEAFVEAGFAVLLYDHRNFGLSGGEPRQEINKWVQARGYRDAIDFASGLGEVDPQRIAIWGDSLSGAEVIVVGAMDPRVGAIVAQVPACGDEMPPADPDSSLFASIREKFLAGDLRGSTEVAAGPLPVVSFDQRSLPSLLPPLTAFRWFMKYGAQYGTGWQNWATLVLPAAFPAMHPGLCAPHLRAPLLMVVAKDDEMPGASSHVARAVFELAAGPKEILEIDGGHFGLLYHPDPLFDQAVAAQTKFLQRVLRKESAA